MISLNFVLFLIILLFLLYIYIKNKMFTLFTSLFLILIFVCELLLSYSGLYPVYIFGYSSLNPISVNLLNSIFIHESFIHIISNVIVFLLIGIPLEQRINARRTMIFFVLTGITANVIFILYNYNTPVILVGASGAIFGLMGVFLRLYPDDEIPMFLGFIFLPRVKVKYAVFVLVLFEIIFEFLNVNDGVAHLAHIAGFFAGYLLAGLNFNYRNFEKLDTFIKNEEDKKELDEIRKINDPLVRKYMIENFLSKKCKNIEIKENYILCDGKKIRL